MSMKLGLPRGREGLGEGGLREMHRLPPPRSPPRGGRRPETGPRRSAGPLGGPAAGGTDDGSHRDTGVVGGRPADHPRFHGGGQPAVVSPPIWAER